MATTEFVNTETLTTLRHRALRMTGNRADAEDLVQNALVRALSYVDKDRQIDNWQGYLTRVLRNVAADEFGRRKRRGTHVDLDDVHGALATPAPQYDQSRLRELHRAMETLPPQQRAVLELVGVEGASYQDAAAQLDVPIGTIMSRLHRGRAALKDRIGDTSVH